MHRAEVTRSKFYWDVVFIIIAIDMIAKCIIVVEIGLQYSAHTIPSINDSGIDELPDLSQTITWMNDNVLLI